jgi:CRP-like cAMP-binding protein
MREDEVYANGSRKRSGVPNSPSSSPPVASGSKCQNDMIASQGDPADCMHFILEGRVGIMVKFDDGRSVRVRSLGPHTSIGEMGLIYPAGAQRHHSGRAGQRALHPQLRGL